VDELASRAHGLTERDLEQRDGILMDQSEDRLAGEYRA